ncbi:MAG: prolyl oligopeptidase family serine peptidase [Beijerinckiaceae bacterium]|nr:prolyl oligopeptidase family serine peptidase [Beijerinckiaceae bacterium]
MKTIAPYGTWSSPVSVELMTGAAIGLSGLSVDGEDLYWLEARPSENGRTVLCRRLASGEIEDVTPPPINAGSRVHEYGGGAYAVEAGVIVFSERSDGSVWAVEAGAAPRKLDTPKECRYADFLMDLARRRVLAVREDFRGRPAADPKAAIVALPLDAGGAETVLAEGPDFLSSPRLSPGGDRLAWIAWDHPAMPWDQTRLYVGEVTKKGAIEAERLVAGETPEAIVQPEWSDGGTLHFCSDRTGWWNLYALHGTAIEPLAPIDAEIGGPHWVFRQRYFAFLPDGRIVAAIVRDGMRTAALIENGRIVPLDAGQVQDCPRPLGNGLAYISTPPSAPPAVALSAGVQRSAPIFIRRAAPSIVPDETISLGEAIDFMTPRGIAHAFWYPPKNRDYESPPGTLPPLIVLSHGGPTSMATNSFSLSVQWWTSRGFGVVDVNYSGSTGYGRAYRERLHGQWGVADVEDCAGAATYLVERGLADGRRLIIRGGSAGGYTTLAALTSLSLFKAGASYYGVGDLMLLAGDTHKFESRYLDKLVGPLPETEALYRERSPINQVDKLSCPVIFFQGEDDKTVPPNQAETMVEAMKTRGLSVAFYSFADEGHGFRKAETLRRTLELELAFYGRVFGFTAPGLSERAEIANMPGSEG